ncbi:ABC transporter permease [Clostridium hydrogeniformans]|uniref:ABC transporter permease n=1 Tax=Clostridium hydrogeniformans TaxID=349933 RepID=UPI0004872498|nr:ABC transporter permease [Clostridium hydrogeniformans]
MVFLNLTLSEIKQQLRSVKFYNFLLLLLIFYLYQYKVDGNRFKPPSSNVEYNKVVITPEAENLVLGYKELHEVLRSKEVIRYLPIAQKVKLSDKQIDNLEEYLDKIAPNIDVSTIKDKDINTNYRSMREYMRNLDEDLGGKTFLGRYYKFMESMTYEEALIDYERQNSDKNITDIYGRILADYLGVGAGLFVVFFSAFSMIRDKECGTQELIYSSKVRSFEYVGAKFMGMFITAMGVFLILGVIETIIFSFQGEIYNIKINPISFQWNFHYIKINPFSFIKYIIGWVAPTVMFTIGLSMLISVVFENAILPIVVQVGATLLLIFNTELTGVYDFTRFIIRFNTVKYGDYYAKFTETIIYNRFFYVGISLLLLLVTSYIWTIKRNRNIGGVLHGSYTKTSE